MKLTELDLDRAQAWRSTPLYTERRFFRTMQAAFGPYTDSHIIETQPRSRFWTAVYAVVCFASFALVGMLLAFRG